MKMKVTHNSWLDRQVTRIKAAAGPTALDAPPDWGTPYILHALSGAEQALVWLTLKDNDPINLGNELAAALKRATGRALIEHGVSYSQTLTLLERYGDTLGPFIFAISGAAYAPEFVRSLHAALPKTHKLVLAGEGSGEILDNADVMTKEMLTVTAQEALVLAGDASLELLERSGGVYEKLLTLATGTQTLRRPKPSRYYFAPDYEPGTGADALIDLLVSKQQFAEALDVATSERPGRVSGLLSRAGSFFAERNLYAKVWDALSRLTTEQRADEVILFALLDAANHMGNVQQVRVEIKTFLDQKDAPDLRALYAMLCLVDSKIVAEVETAYKFLSTPFTTFALGRILSEERGDAVKAVDLFRESLQLAEASSNVFATVRAAWALSTQLTFNGSYNKSVHWSRWGLNLYKAKKLHSPRLHLLLINTLSYTRILTGEVEDLATELVEVESKVSDEHEVGSRLLRTTLGDLFLALQEPGRALSYYKTTSRGVLRENLRDDVTNASRCLAEIGRREEGLDMAEQAYHLAKGTRALGPTALAVARFLAEENPKDALPLAEEAFEYALQVSDAPQLAQAGAWLARIRLSIGDAEGAHEALKLSSRSRAELTGTGLILLECADLPNLDFLASSAMSRLQLNLLGRQEVAFGDEQLELSTRQLELLVLLALNPEGLNVAELQLHLFGEGKHKSLKAILSRLRKLIPITSRPYRLDIGVDADFIKVRGFVETGQLEQAVELYKGPLLSGTESDYIREESDLLQEQIINAVLASRDPELLYTICRVERERLDLWEALLEVLPEDDPRYPASATRVANIQRTWEVQQPIDGSHA